MNGPMTNAERQRRFRERRKANGYRRVTVMLDPEASTKLDAMCAFTDQSRDSVIQAALVQYRLYLSKDGFQ